MRPAPLFVRSKYLMHYHEQIPGQPLTAYFHPLICAFAEEKTHVLRLASLRASLAGFPNRIYRVGTSYILA